jgi:regulator of sirC expression with transglutaminase-like and TPR domain
VQLPEKAELIILQLNPSKCDTSRLWLAVAKHYAERGFWHRAANAVDRALIDEPTSADALMLATIARIQTDDRKQAGVTLARWTAAHPDDPLIEKLRKRYPSVRAAR